LEQITDPTGNTKHGELDNHFIMTTPAKLFLFGDQTFDVQIHLKQLYRLRDDPLLDDFLVKSYVALRKEIYKLPAQVRDDIPRFTATEDLASWNQDGKHCIALDMAITCMCHLGVFISQSEWNVPIAQNSRTLGLCTGVLAAAAVSCSRDKSDLVPLAVEAVIVAFKVGLHVTSAALRLDPSQHSLADQSWSMAVADGPLAVDAVSKFCQASSLPPTCLPYISAYSPGGITVSGPPESLNKLRISTAFLSLRSKSLPIHGPYHSSHCSTHLDVHAILAGLDAGLSSRKVIMPMILSSGLDCYAQSFGSLLKTAVEEVLLHPIQMGRVLEQLEQWLSTSVLGSDIGLVEVDSICTAAGQGIVAALKPTLVVHLLTASMNQNNASMFDGSSSSVAKTSKLAIIGFSGRYPDAKDNEAFWDLLLQGLDVHKPVPDLHWSAETHVDPTGKKKNTSATPFGCWLDNPGDFDAK
jgi:hypothetical protein